MYDTSEDEDDVYEEITIEITLQASPECDSATLPRVEYEGNSWVRFDDDYDHADCCDDDIDLDDGFDVGK